jgi:hypothetical protein
LDVGDLWLYLEQEWLRGRRGTRILRSLLAPRTAGQAPTDSQMELDARALIRRSGLPQPIGQHPEEIATGSIRLDLAYPKLRLAIELDSYSWHLNRKSFESDRRRDAELSLLGWLVLRFTWAMLKFEKERVVEAIAFHYRERQRLFM